ncbi:hypothetical protein VitviT2T_009738 [Vitis vinifera]|uniref:cellulase n=1 Tax=Vitis vinifera TaxID=29760 RepID=A0ABY9C6W6_VITVI|nr:hypothetical protein VitviT2T_009738 [Vitis vinifera]
MDTPRTAYEVNTTSPGSKVATKIAATLVAASIAFNASNSQYSQTFVMRAKSVFDFADKNRGSYNDAIGRVVCPYYYCDGSGYMDKLSWGAAWLYKATNNESYWNYVQYIINNSPKTKFNSDGSTFKHKARLVVKGFAQVVGVDYGDTFAPIARHDTIRLLLALAGQMEWKVYHLDVKSAFLNGILLEDIYVQQPEGFERKYVVDILKEFKLESCKEVATPLAQNEKISKNDGEKLEEPYAYRSLIGSLLYLIATRPDLMFPAGLLSRFMSSPSNVHMGVATSVLKYVRGQEQSSPTKLYCDNKSAIAIAQNPVQYGKTKHMNVKFHYIKEAEKNSLVKLHYCSTDVQLADIMTKALPKSRLEFLRLKFSMSKENLKEEC